MLAPPHCISCESAHTPGLIHSISPIEVDRAFYLMWLHKLMFLTNPIRFSLNVMVYSSPKRSFACLPKSGSTNVSQTIPSIYRPYRGIEASVPGIWEQFDFR